MIQKTANLNISKNVNHLKANWKHILGEITKYDDLLKRADLDINTTAGKWNLIFSKTYY